MNVCVWLVGLINIFWRSDSDVVISSVVLMFWRMCDVSSVFRFVDSLYKVDVNEKIIRLILNIFFGLKILLSVLVFSNRVVNVSV